ncbi:aspartate 1-decarboxylase [Helicobacter baculiformis]|uniref:Aspartate 1-decarboxylase n=1 Tax=Helicobacter baculiformis TaxID=427351 RepID=A0ABV7ZI65_9HELI|nr:aspartate 1-decarboxylase [Helicobacter baculiformis]
MLPSAEVLYSKIHRAVVTDANLHYQGSITIGKDLMQAAKLHPWMKVDVVNINNGARFSTYAIMGTQAREVCVNGAASRLVQIGDQVIILAYMHLSLEQIPIHQPHVILLGENNAILEKGIPC